MSKDNSMPLNANQYDNAISNTLPYYMDFFEQTFEVVLFIYPFSFSVIDVRYSSIAVCLLATFAALQESRFIRTKVCGKQVGICH